MDKILFQGDEESIELFVLDSTRLAGRDFLLVTDVEQGDGDCFILEQLPADKGGELQYRPVEDDSLLDHLANIFGEQLEDVDIAF